MRNTRPAGAHQRNAIENDTKANDERAYVCNGRDKDSGVHVLKSSRWNHPNSAHLSTFVSIVPCHESTQVSRILESQAERI